MFPNVQKALRKRKSVIYKAEWVPMMTDLIRIKERKGFFRWHDSGDIQSLTHLKKIAQIARNLPDIVFWLPTREHAFVRQYMEQYGAFPDNTPKPGGVFQDSDFCVQKYEKKGVNSRRKDIG